MATKIKIVIVILVILLGVATGSALYHWYSKPPFNTVEYIKVPEIKEVIKIKRVAVPGPERIVTIEKRVIVEKLGLPEWIRTNEDEQAIATASIAPYRGKTNAVALLNTKTGVGQIIAKQEPLSLFGFVNDREIGVRAGVGTHGGLETTAYGSWDFVRVGNVHIGIYGEGNIGYGADIRSDAKAQLQFGYKF